VRTERARKAWRNALLLLLYCSSSSPDIVAICSLISRRKLMDIVKWWWGFDSHGHIGPTIERVAGGTRFPPLNFAFPISIDIYNNSSSRSYYDLFKTLSTSTF